MDKQTAERIELRGETAIRELVSLLQVDQVEAQCTPEEYQAIKRAIGLSVGRIDIDLLRIVYAQFPELDPIDRQ